jgi:hypothetical protein
MSDPNLSATQPSTEFEMAVNAAVDHDRLKVLEIAYYIAGAMTILTVSIFLIHFTVCLIFGLNPQLLENHGAASGRHDSPPPQAFFLGFAAIIGTIILLGWIFGAFQIYAARCLRARRNYLFIMIVAGLECVFIPWGTALGVFTFVVMNRLSARALFPA